jgi:hypothetical protein
MSTEAKVAVGANRPVSDQGAVAETTRRYEGKTP